MKNILGLLAMVLSVSSPLYADSEIISRASVIDLGPVAIAEARRALLADIEDWKDDWTALRTRLSIACALVGMPSSAAGVLSDQDPAAPLRLPLSELAEKVSFTDSERKVFASLRGRETGELTDRIRLAIDTRNFLIKVSVRLYDEAIRERLLASRTTCAADRLQADRDTQLLQAAHRVLGLYNLLERELRD